MAPMRRLHRPAHRSVRDTVVEELARPQELRRTCRRFKGGAARTAERKPSTREGLAGLRASCQFGLSAVNAVQPAVWRAEMALDMLCAGSKRRGCGAEHGGAWNGGETGWCEALAGCRVAAMNTIQRLEKIESAQLAARTPSAPRLPISEKKCGEASAPNRRWSAKAARASGARAREAVLPALQPMRDLGRSDQPPAPCATSAGRSAA